jgi:hypothetical protein
MVSNSPAAKTSDANCADRVLVNLDDGAIDDDDVLVIIVLETNVLVDVATPRDAAAVVALSVRIDFTDEHEKCCECCCCCCICCRVKAAKELNI